MKTEKVIFMLIAQNSLPHYQNNQQTATGTVLLACFEALAGVK